MTGVANVKTTYQQQKKKKYSEHDQMRTGYVKY